MSINTQLAEFLSASDRPEGSMAYAELYGYLFVIACAPVSIDVEEWYPLIFNEHDPNYASDEEAVWVREAIVKIYQEQCKQVVSGQIQLPSWCQLAEQPIDNFSETAHLTFWSKGMLEGHDWLGDVWKAYLSPKLDGEMSSCLMVLSFFSDENLAQAYCDEYSHVLSHTVEDMAQTVVDTFHHAMEGYARVGQVMQNELAKLDALPDAEALCACGSGKLFRLCCLH